MDMINPSDSIRAILWNWRIVHSAAIGLCVTGTATWFLTPFLTENKILRGLAIGYSIGAAATIECCFNHLNKMAPRIKAIHDRDTAAFRSGCLADYHVANVTNAMIGDYFVSERKASLEAEPMESLPEASRAIVHLEKSDVSAQTETSEQSENPENFGFQISDSERYEVLKSMADGDTQGETILKVWGAKPGGNKLYKEALAKYRQIEFDIEQEDV
jgi:hypothetical protein